MPGLAAEAKAMGRQSPDEFLIIAFILADDPTKQTSTRDMLDASAGK